MRRKIPSRAKRRLASVKVLPSKAAESGMRSLLTRVLRRTQQRILDLVDRSLPLVAATKADARNALSLDFDMLRIEALKDVSPSTPVAPAPKVKYTGPKAQYGYKVDYPETTLSNGTVRPAFSTVFRYKTEAARDAEAAKYGGTPVSLSEKGILPEANPLSINLPSGGTVNFVPHPNAGRGETTVMVDTRTLDAAWKKDTGYYIPVGEEGIPGRKRDVAKFLETDKDFQASRVTIANDGTVSFIDGRHRFATLRDMGVDRVAVTVPKADLQNAPVGLVTASTPAQPAVNVSVELQKIGQSIATQNAKAMTGILGINVRAASGLGASIDMFRDRNTLLIKSLVGKQIDDVQEILENAETTGLRVEEIRSQIIDKFGVSKSKADLIARDQVLKLNSQVAQTRQRNAGVEKYVWTTSGDERVREEHAERDGQVFSWNAPPEDGHPGEPIQCRCVAFPIIEEFDDL